MLVWTSGIMDWSLTSSACTQGPLILCGLVLSKFCHLQVGIGSTCRFPFQPHRPSFLEMMRRQISRNTSLFPPYWRKSAFPRQPPFPGQPTQMTHPSGVSRQNPLPTSFRAPWRNGWGVSWHCILLQLPLLPSLLPPHHRYLYSP